MLQYHACCGRGDNVQRGYCAAGIVDAHFRRHWPVLVRFDPTLAVAFFVMLLAGLTLVPALLVWIG